MKIIIAGGRDFNDYEALCLNCDLAIKSFNYTNIEIVSGKAPGADTLGERYAREKGYPVKPFPADWTDFSEPCLIRTRKDGTKYNALAGTKRNKQMAEYADALICFWDGKSKGTKDMIALAKKNNLQMTIYYCQPMNQ